MSRYSVSRRRKPIVNCLSCGEIILNSSKTENKYCNLLCYQVGRWEQKKQDIYEGKVQSNSSSMIKFLIEKDGYKCSECGISDWQDKEIKLDVDHIDADHNNNKPENLRFLCPNCHRQTPTWGNSMVNRRVKAGNLVIVNTLHL